MSGICLPGDGLQVLRARVKLRRMNLERRFCWWLDHPDQPLMYASPEHTDDTWDDIRGDYAEAWLQLRAAEEREAKR